MKIFNIFLILKFVYSSDPFFVNEVVILENNYWGEAKALIKTKEGFLNTVVVEMINTKKQDGFESLIIPSDCYYDPEKKRYLFVISSDLTNKILSKINSKHEENYAILNFQYFYSDTQLEDNFSMADYEGKFYFYENYKILINETDDTIKFKDDAIKSYICHVKKMMQNLFNCKYVVLEDFDKDLIDQNLNVPLYYFDSQRSCYENFEKFVAFLNFLKLENEGTELEENDDNLLKISFLDKYLRNKFNLDYKNKKDVKIYQFYDRIESFFEQCCYEIKEQLTKHKIILPIKGTLTVEFYLDRFYELIKEAIESSLKNIDQNYCENVPATFCANFLVFKRDLKRMSKSIINNTWESLCVLIILTSCLEEKF